MKNATMVGPATEPPPATEGLTPLDQDRAVSVADEGGAAAAVLESQEPAESHERPATPRPSPGKAKRERKRRARS